MDIKALTLYEVLGQVKTVLKNNAPPAWWIVAEIGELKVNYSGHCYLELIEKDDDGISIRAKARATIWSSVFRMLKPYFETTTNATLVAGMKVMLKVSAEFHELYGFSLNITDIEPSFTLGELARQKQEIIRRLKADGVFEMNKGLHLPELPRKIAVISSVTAAGYGDFHDQLTRNPFGYKFYLRLFPAAMQGKEAEASIIEALDSIYRYDDFFDVVVLIRGGGSQSDLNCFNSYWLASHLCQFPLPVLTGIGHEQDETIADLVAHTRLKTPTAVAEFLISRFQLADEKINELSDNLIDAVTEKVSHEKERLSRFTLQLKPAAREMLNDASGQLRLMQSGMAGSVKHLVLRQSTLLTSKAVRLQTQVRENLSQRQHKIRLLEEKCNYLDPFTILKRGYSITYYQGKALKNSIDIASGEPIETRLAEGFIKSKTI
ncbi:MAG: exodeoxyribonuclease VII large subunit [Bacteroidales bacterium]|nr:exodeoxyribonuclease VII large subunit [Bacteroidales bacterium]